MNAFIKNCLKIAGISIFLGLLLVIISFSMDNTVFDNWENFNITLGNNNNHSGRWTDPDNPEEWDDWDNEEEWNKEEASVTSDSFKDVKSLLLDISYGTVEIKKGDSFNIHADNIGSDEYYSTIEDGVWKIGDNRENSNNEISVFGIKISDSAVHPFNVANIELTIPEDFVFENLDIILNAGTIKAERLAAENADIDVGAGSLHMEELSAENKSSYSIDTGELAIENLTAHNANINCGVGNVNASGIITGDSMVTCGIGNVSLDIEGNENDYNYNIDCGIGTVIINSNSYSGVNSKTKANNNAKNSFDLDCGIGKIALKIHE